MNESYKHLRKDSQTDPQNSGYKNAQTLRGEAIQHKEKGWLLPPSPLSTEASPLILQHPQLNVAFRFGVEQSNNLRACGDLRHARTNLACAVETPIKLVRWRHLAELSNLVKLGGRDWAFFKADNEAAYKQLPLDPKHTKLAVIPPAHRMPNIGTAFSAVPWSSVHPQLCFATTCLQGSYLKPLHSFPGYRSCASSAISVRLFRPKSPMLPY